VARSERVAACDAAVRCPVAQAAGACCRYKRLPLLILLTDQRRLRRYLDKSQADQPKVVAA
jgi:hypothetical protein